MAYPVIASSSSDTTQGADDSEITLAQPSGLSTDDLLIIIYANENGNINDCPDLSADGFTRITHSNNGGDVQAAIYWQIEDGTVSWPYSVGSGGSDAAVGWALRITGVDTTTPINQTGSWFGVGSTGSSCAPTGVTPDVDDCLGLAIAAWDGSDISNNAVTGTGWSHIANLEDPTNNGQAVEADYATKQLTKDTASGTVTFTASGSDGRVGIQIAIAPAAAGPITITFQGDPPDGNGEVTLAGKVPVLNVTQFPAKESLSLAGKVPVLDLTIYPVKAELRLRSDTEVKVPYSFLRLKTQVGLGLEGQAPTAVVTESADKTITFTGGNQGAGELDLTGKAATVHWTVTPARDELDLTGKVPVVALGMPIGKGTLTVEGKVPVLDITFIYSEAIDSLEIIEKTVRLAYTIRDPPVEELDLQGKAPTVGLAFYPDREQLDLSGKAATVHWTVSPARDELDLTGKTPVLNLTFEPDRDQLDLVGKQATVHWTITPGRLELSLTGTIPSIPLQVPAGSLSLTGKIPYLGQIQIDTGTLTLAGKTPVLNLSISPARDELDLTGKVPTVHWTVTSARDELDLTGKIPVLNSASYPVRDELTLAGKVPTLDLAFRPPGDRTNRLARANDFDTSPWTTDEATLTDVTSTVLPPDVPGITKTWYLQTNANSAQHRLIISGYLGTLPAGTAESMSIYAKAGPTYDKMMFQIPADGNHQRLGFDITNGVQFGQSSPSYDRYRILDVGNGWWRPEATTDSKGVELAQDYWNVIVDDDTPANSGIFSGDGTGIYLAGAQFETYGVATQFIPSDASPESDALVKVRGYAPTVHTTVTPARDELDLTGKIPVLDLTISPARYQLSLAGKAPLLPIIVGKGSLSLTGYAPAVDAIQPAKGTLTLAGKVPTVHWTITPTEDQLDLTGKALVLDLSITSARDELDLTGKTPVLDLSITPARDELDLAGKVPTVHWSITPTEVDLTLAGKQATVHWSVTPGRLELSLAGYAPTLGALLPEVGELSLTGKVPETINSGEVIVSVPYSELILYSVRGLQLKGIAPTVVVSLAAFSPDKGTLSLTGKVPTLAYSWTIEPARGELLLTSYAPFIQEFVAQPDKTALALAGQTPKVKRGPPVQITVPRLSLATHGYNTTRAYGFLLVGHAPTYEVPGVFYPTSVDLTLTTYAPEAINTSVPPVEVLVPQGQELTLTGVWPVLGIINPNQEDTFILTGYEPLAESSSPFFFPAVGTLQLDGIQIISDVEGLAPEALLSLTGQQPNTQAATIIPGTGSLSLTGYQVSLNPEPPAALLSLTGSILYTRRTVTPSAGAVTLSSTAPTAREGINTYIIPDAGSLALSGKAPVSNVGFNILVSSGGLTATGYVTEAGYTRSFEVDTSEIHLSGYSPTLSIDLPVDVVEGELLLNMQTFKMKLKKHKIRGARKQLVSLSTEYDIEILYR